MNIADFFKQYSFLFILLIFTFLFLGLKLLLNTQDKSIDKETIATFTEKNIFYLILSVFVILIGFYIYNIVKFYKKKPIKKIKPSYEVHTVHDQNEPIIVQNTELDCPQDESMFSFSLYLHIDDFYCNRDYWKCIFIKGQDFNDKTISKCKLITTSETNKLGNMSDIKDQNSLDTIITNNNVITSISNDLTFKDLGKFYYKKEHPKYKILFEDIDLKEDLNKRVDLICKVLDNSDGMSIEKIALLKYLCKHYSLFNKKSIDEDIIQNFLDKHKKYCKTVYAINKKVSKGADPSLLHKDDKTRFYDDYDNICNKSYLKEEYNYLLPKNLNINKEIRLIDLSKKNQLDVFNPNPENNIEGKYYIKLDGYYELFENSIVNDEGDVLKNLIDKQTIETDSDVIIALKKVLKTAETLAAASKAEAEEEAEAEAKTAKTAKAQADDVLEKAKTTALEKLQANPIFNYAAPPGVTNIYDTANKYGLTYSVKIHIKESSDTEVTLLLGHNKEKELYKYKSIPIDSSGNPESDYYVLKVEKIIDIEKYSLKKCWENITDTFVDQSPGVWLHPYVNNIRICLTTYSHNDYNKTKHDIIHPYKFTNNNYYIRQLAKRKDKKKGETTDPGNIHPEKGEVNPKICPKTNIDTEHEETNMYLEYFDIENIPIKEEFHLAIVLNKNIVETYFDGRLKQSIKLFGDIKYSNEPLQINSDSKKIKLGGVINSFKYYPYALKPNHILNIINERSDTIKLEPNNMSSNDHEHNIQVSHEHHYDTDIETDHKHSVHDSDIKQEYYLEN